MLHRLRLIARLSGLCLLTTSLHGAIGLQKVATAEMPISVAQIPTDGGPLLVLQRNGILRVADLSTPDQSGDELVSLTSLSWDHDKNPATAEIKRQVHQEVETGAFSIALQPDFTKKGGVLYLRYVDTNGPPGRWGGHERIDVILSANVQFNASSKSYQLDTQSLREIYRVPQSANSHNGGWMGFDPIAARAKPARFLLCASYGDDESLGWPNPSDRTRRPQQLDNPYGKILRFELKASTDDKPYTIPKDNPFTKVTGALPEILHVGMRNPWRCSFDRKTGALWIGDVGHHHEEINMAAPGAVGLNFGWPLHDGNGGYPIPKEGDATRWNAVMKDWKLVDGTSHTPPLHAYHLAGGQSIIGGYLYRGKAMPQLQGQFIFSDYFADKIQIFDPRDLSAQQSEGIWELRTTASYGEGHDGEVYACSFSAGAVFKLVAR